MRIRGSGIPFCVCAVGVRGLLRRSVRRLEVRSLRSVRYPCEGMVRGSKTHDTQAGGGCRKVRGLGKKMEMCRPTTQQEQEAGDGQAQEASLILCNLAFVLHRHFIAIGLSSPSVFSGKRSIKSRGLRHGVRPLLLNHYLFPSRPRRVLLSFRWSMRTLDLG